MRHLKSLLVVTLLAAGLPGCMSYRLDLLPQIDQLPAPPAPDQRPTLAYVLRVAPGGELGPGNGNITTAILGSGGDEIGAGLLRSGWFRSVDSKAPDKPADLELDIVLTSSANDIIPIVSACLLYIVPTWRTVTFDLSVEARARDGRWRRYEYVDAARDVNWLPLVLVMSVNPWGEVYPEVRANMIRHLVRDLHDDGFLAPPAPAPEPAAPAK